MIVSKLAESVTMLAQFGEQDILYDNITPGDRWPAQLHNYIPFPTIRDDDEKRALMIGEGEGQVAQP